MGICSGIQPPTIVSSSKSSGEKVEKKSFEELDASR